MCHERSDQWAKDVELRVLGAMSDLHAADARYHRDCRPSFMGLKSLTCVGTSETKPHTDGKFVQLIKVMESDKDKLWSSTEVYKQYTDSNGTKIQKRALIDAISKHFGERLLLLSCKGLATLLVFRTRASQLVQLVEEPDGDFQADKSVAKQILTESKAINLDTKSYCTRINNGIACAESSGALLFLLSEISPKLSGSLLALLIGKMVTNAVTNRPTKLQVALGVSAREKHMINTLHNFSVTCSYDEVLRFKSSAAHNAVN